MTGPTNPWQPPAPEGAGAPPPPPAYAPSPGYYPPPAPPPPGYGAPGPAPGWHGALWGDGPPGQVRPTGRMILLFVITFGIYGYIYSYRVHEEMKRHSGRGLGGGIALLLMFLAGIAMPFLTSSEVGGLYARKGRPEPVRAWTGMWVLGPAIGGYVVMLAVIFGLAAAEPAGSTSGIDVLFLMGIAAYLLCVAAGMAVWFTKTNEALNRYWQSVTR